MSVMQDATAKVKPTKTFNWWDTRRGKYNFLAPSEETTMYRFHLREDAPSDIEWRSADFRDETDPCIPENEDPDECARRVLEAHEKAYIASTSRDSLRKLVSYLESCAEQDWIDRCEYEVDLAQWEAAQATVRELEWAGKLKRAKATAKVEEETR